MNVQGVLTQLHNLRKSGSGWSARCPAHDDEHNSLSVAEGQEGRLLLHCHANCSFENIMAAISPIHIYEGSRVVQTYDYLDENGNLLFQVCRTEPKGFFQRRPNGNGGFINGLGETRRVLYRLPELLEADPLHTVFLTEGEKDVDTLYNLGLIATSNPGGAGKWRDEYNESLSRRSIVILPDNDEPGREHARKVAKHLQGKASSVRVLELPDLPPKGDVSDWISSGGTVEQLIELAERSPLWTEDKDTESLSVILMADVEVEEVRWLWYPYIAYGKLTILEGDPGLGKSWITCAIAAGVSCGRGLPGLGVYKAGNVLMLSAEDGLSDTLRPRLNAIGADVSRIFALAEPLTFDTAGLVKLEAAIIKYKPKLVVIDPFFAFTGAKTDIHRANECRAISAPLAAIAQRQGCALLAVRHLGKSRGGGHALNAGIGSIDFAAAARSVLLVGADSDAPNKRGIVQVKNNLAPHGEAVGYRLEGGKFYWSGASDLTAGRILSAMSDESHHSALTDAIDFLRDSLVEGPREVGEVTKEARQIGISERTLRRAREMLKIRAQRKGQPGSKQQFYWTLDNDQSHQDNDQITEDGHHRTSEEDKDS